MNISIVGTVNFGINASKMVLTINNKRRGSSGGGVWGRNTRGAATPMMNDETLTTR